MGCGSSKTTETTSQSHQTASKVEVKITQKTELKTTEITAQGHETASKEEVKTSQKTKLKTTETTSQGHQTAANEEAKTELNAPPKGFTDKSFVKEALDAHNEYRSMHGVPPLTVADDLNVYAQQWAEKIAKKDTMEHSNCTMASGERLGENIYYCWSSDPSAGVKARDAVTSWYDEIKDYNYNKATFGMNTGHFTQVVWKGTEKMGIGTAKSDKGSHYVVASYRPPGNMLGDFEQNVLPKL